VTFAKVSPDG